MIPTLHYYPGHKIEQKKKTLISTMLNTTTIVGQQEFYKQDLVSDHASFSKNAYLFCVEHMFLTSYLSQTAFYNSGKHLWFNDNLHSLS
jgi:hypothetical protein